jgi:CRISPR type III-A-associated RAMP protein Csm5
MKIQLKTITPVHVGNGEELFDLDYVVYNGYYYRVTQQQFLNFIKDIPDGIEKYTTWISDTTTEMNELKEQKKRAKRNRNSNRVRDYNQQFNDIKYNFNLLNFAEQINQKKAFIHYLNQQIGMVKIPFRGSLKGQIRGQIKTATNQVYLPGSSIKGAIRTALLYHYLSNHANIKSIKEILEKDITYTEKEKRKYRDARDWNRKQDAFKKKFGRDIEINAFYCANNYYNTKTDKWIIKEDDEKLDILKFLSISDGIIQDNNKANLRLADIKLYLITKEKNRRTNKVDIIAKEQTQAPYVEAIDENILIEASINFDIDFFLHFKNKLTAEGIRTNEGWEWIGLAKKIQQIFGLDIFTLTANNLEEKRNEVYLHIKKCLRVFSQRQINANKNWIENFKREDKKRLYSKKIDAGFRDLHELKDGNLIHLGFGTGFSGVTGLLYVLKHEELKKSYFRIMELFRLGDKPNNKGNYIPNPEKFPKSRRLIKNRDSLQPLGWLAIIDEQLNKIKNKKTRTEVKTKVTPIFYTKVINPKKPPILDAVIIKSATVGKFNEVKVFITPENQPIFELKGYKSPIAVDTIVTVKTAFNRKKQLIQVVFNKMK